MPKRDWQDRRRQGGISLRELAGVMALDRLGGDPLLDWAGGVSVEVSEGITQSLPRVLGAIVLDWKRRGEPEDHIAAMVRGVVQAVQKQTWRSLPVHVVGEVSSR